MPEYCSYDGCQFGALSKSQAETTTKLLLKPYCPAHASTVMFETADGTPMAGYISVLRKNLWDLEKGLAVKKIGEVEVKLVISRLLEKSKAVEVGGFEYDFGANPEVDKELKKIFSEMGLLDTKPAPTEKKEKWKEAPAEKPAPKKEQPKKEEIKEDKPIMNKPEPIKEPETRSLSTIQTSGIVRPAVSAQEAIAAWKEFNELKLAIISNDDKQKIGDKQFIKKSGWRKLAQYFNISDEIVEELQIPHPEGAGWTWKIKVVATAPNGRKCEGVGICSTGERKFAHIEHDTYAQAHTRAKNRAISDMIAFGEVSAEELE